MSKDDDSSAHLYHSTDQPLVLDAETLEPPSKKAPLDLEAIEARRQQWATSDKRMAERYRLGEFLKSPERALLCTDIPALTREVRRLLVEREEVTHALDSTGYNREDWTQAEVVQLLGNVITEGKERISSLTVEVERLKEDVEAGLQLTGSFFEALKPLGLEMINVADPGAHITALIVERDIAEAEVERLKEKVGE